MSWFEREIPRRLGMTWSLIGSCQSPNETETGLVSRWGRRPGLGLKGRGGCVDEASSELDERRPGQRGIVPEPLAIGAAHPLVAIDIGGALARQVELVLAWADLGGAADAGIGRGIVLRKGRHR